jgi:hypothetical protein
VPLLLREPGELWRNGRGATSSNGGGGGGGGGIPGGASASNIMLATSVPFSLTILEELFFVFLLSDVVSMMASSVQATLLKRCFRPGESMTFALTKGVCGLWSFRCENGQQTLFTLFVFSFFLQQESERKKRLINK